MSPWRPLLGQLCWCLIFRSLPLIWRSGNRRWNLRVPDLQMFGRDLTTQQGTRIIALAMVAERHALLIEVSTMAGDTMTMPRRRSSVAPNFKMWQSCISYPKAMDMMAQIPCEWIYIHWGSVKAHRTDIGYGITNCSHQMSMIALIN